MSVAPRRAALAPGAETLVQAARAVAMVVHDGRSADDALAVVADGREDRAAIRAVTLGTLRWWLRLEPAVAALLSRPAAEAPPDLLALLVVAAHQVVYSRGAPEVSVHLAVDATRGLGRERASGFVNAVLRRFVRERELRLAAADAASRAVRTAHPPWLERALAEAWPDRVEAILAAANEHPPMTLRVDPAHGTADDYVRELAAAGRAATTLPWRPGAVVLAQPAPVASLPGFREGHVSIQDAGAQLAAPLLELAPGLRVLDACAAPGGKAAHMLELEPALGALLAVDVDGARLALVAEGLERQGRLARAERLVADLGRPGVLGERRFDRVLVDAPCTATGVIRRHPDVKLLRRAADVARVVQLQRRILAEAYRVLVPGGLLVYSTCSLLPPENEGAIDALLAATPDAHVLPWPGQVPLPPGAAQLRHGVQLLPGAEAGTDGFYYCRLGRRAAP
jgi:16S rRNA (cytosine967-C5)-methyltransferase